MVPNLHGWMHPPCRTLGYSTPASDFCQPHRMTPPSCPHTKGELISAFSRLDRSRQSWVLSKIRKSCTIATVASHSCCSLCFAGQSNLLIISMANKKPFRVLIAGGRGCRVDTRACPTGVPEPSRVDRFHLVLTFP